LNNGDGTFQSPVNYGVGYGPLSVYGADLDGDGDIDLAVTNGSYNVSILLNNGDGTFQSPVNYSIGVGPISVYGADLDGDGDIDLAVSNEGSGNVSILLNNGDGTFQSPVNYSAGSYPNSVYGADLDGDGDIDLAVSNRGSNNVSILLNDGDGTFQNAVNYGAGNGPTSIYGADFDGDGDIDLAVANGEDSSVSILFNLAQSTGVVSDSSFAQPDLFILRQNYPNPFRERTSVSFTVAKRCRVSLKLYDISGRHIRTFVDGMLNPGDYNVMWDGYDKWHRRVPSGVYFMVLEADRVKKTIKMLRIR